MLGPLVLLTELV